MGKTAHRAGFELPTAYGPLSGSPLSPNWHHVDYRTGKRRFELPSHFEKPIEFELSAFAGHHEVEDFGFFDRSHCNVTGVSRAFSFCCVFFEKEDERRGALDEDEAVVE